MAVTGLDQERVVRLRVAPRGGEGPPWRFGSGYLIATGVVLTACHVLEPPDSEEQPEAGDVCEVLAWPCDSDEGWLAASVAWADSDRDIALVSVAAEVTVSPVRFGRLEGAVIVSWSAVGFPVASLDAEGRQPESAFGRTSPISQAPGGRLALTVESREPRSRQGNETGWAGLSGAAVFCGEHLVGVVTTDPGEWTRSLGATRITAVTDLEAFREALDGGPVVEQAGGLDEFEKVLDRLPPGPADQAMLEAYLAVLADELDQDPWTRAGGGRVSSLTAMARRLGVHARPDIGYGVKDQRVEEVEDADQLVERCERLVVLGGPGAGKTWLARRSIINAAKTALQALADDADPASIEIPLFARCAVVLAADADAWEAVIMAALREVGHRFGSERVSQALNRRFLEQPGRYLVALDGLDEAEHLPARDLLNRLPAVAGRELRILLTTRPSSWQRQLPMDEKNQRHRLADLQPLRYPEDVTAVVSWWLAEQPEARDRLTTLLEQRYDLAQLATTPLLCAMYCLLAGSGQPLPQTRRKLQERMVTRLLQGSWHLQPVTGGQLAAARVAVRELAWAGAAAEPATGLGAWPEEIIPAPEANLPESVLAAISHVAPVVEYDPDEPIPPRRFVHRSIREHLVAEYLASLPAAEATSLIEPHLWYDREWEQVLPAAVAGHPQCDAVLHALLVGDAVTPATWQAVDRRDGFGELRRLLERLATETSPTDWNDEHARLIDGVSHELTAAALGWPGARPGPEQLAELQAGRSPWSQQALRDWVGYLELTPATREKLVQTLLGYLRTGIQSRHFSTNWELDSAIALDALGLTEQQRAASAEGLTHRLRSNGANVDAAVAFRLLARRPAPNELVQAVRDQLPNVDDKVLPETRAAKLTKVLVVLGAEPTVRRWAIGVLLDRLATFDDRPDKALYSREAMRAEFVGAIAQAGPSDEQRAQTVDLLLGIPGQLDSHETRELVQEIRRVLPAGPASGNVLRHLVAAYGPWERTQPAGEVLDRLSTTATKEDRRAAVAAVHRRIEGATGSQLQYWVTHLMALHPAAEERSAVVEHLLGRLPDTPIESIGFITSTVRDLGADAEQRDRLVRHLVDFLGSVGEASWLCEMVSWFSPEGAARSAIVEALIKSARLLNDDDYSFRTAVEALPLTADQRRRLIDALAEKLPAVRPWSALMLAATVAKLGPTPAQQARLVELLLPRLGRARNLGDLDVLVETLDRVDPAATWQPAAAAVVVPALLQASPGEVRYLVWHRLLPKLLPSEDDRRRVVDALVPLIGSGYLNDALGLLDTLGPSGPQQQAITDQLVSMLASGSDYQVANVAQQLVSRGLRPEQQQLAVRHLLGRLDVAGSAVPDLLQALAQLGPDDDQRRAAVGAARRRFQDDPSNTTAILQGVAQLGGLHDEESRRWAVGLILDRLITDRRTWNVSEPDRRLLLEFGFDAAALADLAGRQWSHPYAESILRDLADALRHTCDPGRWQSMLASWADAHAAPYRGGRWLAETT